MAICSLTIAGCGGGGDGGPADPPDQTPAPAGSGLVPPGELWSAGLNRSGQLGRTGDEAALAPVQATAGKRVMAVAAGGRHSLAVLSDGTVLSWGADDRGQLGHGRPGPDTAPALVIAPDGADGVLRDVVSVAADTDFSMALRSDGTVVSWGAGDAGQRGNGVNSAPPHPTQVLAPDGPGPLTNVKQISADGRTELALLNDGRVVAWGVNTYGMLGDGTTTARDRPVQVLAPSGASPLTGVQQVAVGGQNGLALLDDGSVLSWGHNDLGQLGDGTRQDRHRPGPVAGAGGAGTLTGVTQITAAEKHAFALRTDGSAVAWGNNTAGQLGDGTTQLSTTPEQVIGAGGAPQSGIRELDAGEAYGAAVLQDGSLLTWGAGGKGQLGSGDPGSRATPGPFSAAAGQTLRRVLTVAAGERHLLVLAEAG